MPNLLRKTMSFVPILFFIVYIGCGKQTASPSFSFAPDNQKPGTVQKGTQVELNLVMHIGSQTIPEIIGQPPKVYIFGQGQLLPSLEKQIQGMAVGEKKTVTLNPEEAYGPVDMTKVYRVPRTSLPPALKIAKGELVTIPQPDGTKKNAIIRDLVDDFVIIDFNNPLAGQTIAYDIEVKSITVPTQK